MREGEITQNITLIHTALGSNWLSQCASPMLSQLSRLPTAGSHRLAVRWGETCCCPDSSDSFRNRSANACQTEKWETLMSLSFLLPACDPGVCGPHFLQKPPHPPSCLGDSALPSGLCSAPSCLGDSALTQPKGGCFC